MGAKSDLLDLVRNHYKHQSLERQALLWQGGQGIGPGLAIPDPIEPPVEWDDSTLNLALDGGCLAETHASTSVLAYDGDKVTGWAIYYGSELLVDEPTEPDPSRVDAWLGLEHVGAGQLRTVAYIGSGGSTQSWREVFVDIGDCVPLPRVPLPPVDDSDDDDQ